MGSTDEQSNKGHLFYWTQQIRVHNDTPVSLHKFLQLSFDIGVDVAVVIASVEVTSLLKSCDLLGGGGESRDIWNESNDIPAS